MGGFQRGTVYSVQGTGNRAVINVITRCTVCSGWLKLYIDVLDFVYTAVLIVLFFFFPPPLSFPFFLSVRKRAWGRLDHFLHHVSFGVSQTVNLKYVIRSNFRQEIYDG